MAEPVTIEGASPELVARQFERLQQIENVLANGAARADDPECHPLYPHAVAARQILSAEIERLTALLNTRSTDNDG